MITTDSDLAITGSIQVEGELLQFGLAARSGAAVGEHTLEVDDGSRRYIVPVEVEAYEPIPSTGCQTSGGGAAGMVGLIALLGLRRKRYASS